MAGIDVPQPANGVSLLLAGDEGILFDQVGQRLFHLNSFACCIWCHIEDGLPAETLVGATTRSICLETAKVRPFVLDMLEKWQHLGLLRGGDAPLPVIRGSLSSSSPPSAQPAPFPEIAVLPKRRLYQMLDSHFSLGFSSSALESLVHPVLAHLEMDGAELHPCRLDLVETSREIHLLQDGARFGSCRSRDGLAPLVQGTVGLLALRRHPYLMALHAAGLATPKGALLIAGHGGSGKTTLAAALLAAGWSYLSDDTILLETRTLEATPVPYALGIKAGSWPLLMELHPTLMQTAVHRREDGKTIRYLNPPRRSYTQPWPVRWIVFPGRTASATSDIRPLTQLEGLQRVFEHCCAIPHNLAMADVQNLIDWSRDIRFFDMAVADLNSATAQLNLIVAGQDEKASKSDLRLLTNSSKS
jgi:hypothetical protein